MQPSQVRFVDLFAGCGGLSLGLSWSGAQGLFAVERDTMAFETFKANFLDSTDGRITPFCWPSWLERRAWSIDELLEKHSPELGSLSGVDLVAGGPPCQGFSFAGRRNPDDPRNLLFRRYLDFVGLVRPKAVLLENVPGMAVAHGLSRSTKRGPRGNASGSYFEVLSRELERMGYEVEGRVVDASRFGVPQRRARLIVVGLLADRFRRVEGPNLASQVFGILEIRRAEFLKDLGLDAPVSAQDAIGDLALVKRDGELLPLRACDDPASPRGFVELAYDGRRAKSAYQRLMRANSHGEGMDSMRLARHTEEVRYRFRQIIRTCRQGVRMNEDDRAIFQLRKHRIYPMSASEPAPTVTTLPDDIVHYSEPRILTVREYARLQSFPDWFLFRGKYTTGGNRRTKECPRYTQVGNAVPPLLSMAIGRALCEVIRSTEVEGRVDNPVDGAIGTPPAPRVVRG